MAATPATTFGATLAFGTSSYAPLITDIDGLEPTRSAIETSHIGLSAYDSGFSAFRTFIPGGLIDGGELSFDIVWNGGDEPPISGVVETITITFTGTGATDCAIAFPGFVTSYKFSGALDDRWTGSVTVKCAGEPTFTPST